MGAAGLVILYTTLKQTETFQYTRKRGHHQTIGKKKGSFFYLVCVLGCSSYVGVLSTFKQKRKKGEQEKKEQDEQEEAVRKSEGET